MLRSPWVRGAVAAAGAPAAATLIALSFHGGDASAVSIYILAVVAATAIGGLWTGLASAILSFLGLNFFFTPPQHTFRVSKGEDLVALIVFLIVAVIVGTLLARALEMHGLKESELKVVNTSDSDIGPAFIADKSQKAVVTWNPMVMTIEQTPGVSKIFDSSKIPGEILDLLVVNTNVLNQDPRFAEALVGAWYEVMGVMSQRGPEADKAMTAMAKRSNASLNEYKAQLRTTAMFWTPEAAIDYTRGTEIKEKMDFVRNFCFKHGLLGENAPSVDIVGISYPDGTIQGDSRNVKLRFDTRVMEKAKAGQLRQN